MKFIKGKIYSFYNYCFHDNPSTFRREHWCNGVLIHSYTKDLISELSTLPENIFKAIKPDGICLDPWVDNQIKGYSKAKTCPSKDGKGWNFHGEMELHHEVIGEYNEEEYNQRAQYLKSLYKG